ncbi:hypothetical protein LINGRAHAP2_LOCUS8219 [Linum grandiflorum]
MLSGSTGSTRVDQRFLCTLRTTILMIFKFGQAT